MFWPNQTHGTSRTLLSQVPQNGLADTCATVATFQLSTSSSRYTSMLPFRPDDPEERVPEQGIVKAGDAALISFWTLFSSRSSNGPTLSVTTFTSSDSQMWAASFWRLRSSVRKVSGHLFLDVRHVRLHVAGVTFNEVCTHLRQSRHPRVDLGLLVPFGRRAIVSVSARSAKLALSKAEALARRFATSVGAPGTAARTEPTEAVRG